MTPAERIDRYRVVNERLAALLVSEDDWIATLATVACELHHAFPHFHWTGFYRVTAAEQLVIGPYQGSHGCLRIPFARGVCGAAARTRVTQLVPDVDRHPDHIACSSTTRSEIVVPILGENGETIAVLDIDSDLPAAFDDLDRIELEGICLRLARRFPRGEASSRRHAIDGSLI